jgi:hypothetical protein
MSVKKSKISSIVSVNAYTDKFYTLKDQNLKPLKKLSYNGANYVTAYLSNKDMITTTIEVSRSISEEDIEDIIETKVYEELGLDQANEYIIEHIEGEPVGDDRVYHVFVIEPEVVEELFPSITEETKYIDLIVPAPLLFQPLYHKEILHREDGVHCFIYFTLQDAFVTFYKNGEYLYSKSIDYSLESIYDKYCDQVGEPVDQNEFFKILEVEGLKTIHADYQQNFMKLFGEIFITINDIVIYVKRAYDLPTINQMFVGSSNGPIIGLDEYSENYLGLKSSELNFDFDMGGDEWYIDQFQYLMALVSLEYLENEESTVNLTLFTRPPEFYKRTSGQFIISIVAATMLGISYPLYFLLGSYTNDAQNFILQQEETTLTGEANKYKGILGEKKAIINQLDEKIEKLTLIYKGKEKTITSIYDKKVHYKLKSELFYKFAIDIESFNVNVSEVTSENDNFTFSLFSDDNKKITNLIQHISEKYFDKIDTINIDDITKDDNTSTYKSILKVDLK